MNTKESRKPWLSVEYFENRAKFPLDELAKYAGLNVAYSQDGASILAAGADEDEVEDKLQKMGLDPSQFVIGYVDPL